MPTKQFFNLVEEKRNVLIEAAKDELNRVAINDFSINQVVKTAGIARGSFYIYFKNVQDIIEYIMQEYINKLEENMILSLKKNNGDIFETYIEIFKSIVIYIVNEENSNMKRNIIKYLIDNFNSVDLDKCIAEKKRFLVELNANIDKTILNISSEKELLLVYDILNSVFKQSIEEIVILGEDKNNIIKRYLDKMNILKSGLKARGGINEK